MTGRSGSVAATAAAVAQPAGSDGGGAATTELLQRLCWYSAGWSVDLKPELLRPGGICPPNPAATTPEGQPATLAALCAAYELAGRGPDAWQALLTLTLCGGVRDRTTVPHHTHLLCTHAHDLLLREVLITSHRAPAGRPAARERASERAPCSVLRAGV
jgi:hypothetical protein